MSSILVDPTSSAAGGQFSLAPRRFRDLDGRTVGLLNSSKFNSDNLLNGIADLLVERYAVKDVIRRRKGYFGRPVERDLAEEMASTCDVVITAIGD
ncbi:MAG TPA: hypothetical protein VE953_24845 [Terriglobales bacterium]|nr:hypothetical protein [Terriglobales bacterium]